jgi:hypothetical protein
MGGARQDGCMSRSRDEDRNGQQKVLPEVIKKVRGRPGGVHM